MAKILIIPAVAATLLLATSCNTPSRVPGTVWNQLDFDFYPGIAPDQKF